MLDPLIQKIENLAQDVALREGVRIYDIEFAGSAMGRTLRVFIDKDGGVSVDDCANVSRGLNLLLDVEDIIPGGKYVLEVSSPGLERVLRKPWHFEQAKGQKVWLKIAKPLEVFGVTNGKLKSAKQLSETLADYANESLKFNIEGVEAVIPLTEIEKAKTVFEPVKQVKPGHPGQKFKKK